MSMRKFFGLPFYDEETGFIKNYNTEYMPLVKVVNDEESFHARLVDYKESENKVYLEGIEMGYMIETDPEFIEEDIESIMDQLYKDISGA